MGLQLDSDCWSLMPLKHLTPLGGVGGPLPPPPLPLLLDDEDDVPGGDFGGLAKLYSFEALGDPLLEPLPFDLLPPP